MGDVYKEAFKELIRVILLAVVPVTILSMEKGELDWRSLGIAGALAVLRSLDKWIHEWAKETGRDIRGISPV